MSDDRAIFEVAVVRPRAGGDLRRWRLIFGIYSPHHPGSGDEGARFFWKGNGRLEMTGENLARLLKGLTIAVGHRKNRILLYQFLAAEIRALHYSYGVGDSESYKRTLTFLENCKRLTLRSMVRKSA